MICYPRCEVVEERIFSNRTGEAARDKMKSGRRKAGQVVMTTQFAERNLVSICIMTMQIDTSQAVVETIDTETGLNTPPLSSSTRNLSCFICSEGGFLLFTYRSHLSTIACSMMSPLGP